MTTDRHADRLRRAGRRAEVPPEVLAGLRARAQRDALVDVAYTETDSPAGRLLLAATDRGLVRVAFPGGSREEVLADLATRLSPRVLEAPARLDPVRRELDAYFAGKLRRFTVPVDWSLSKGFYRRVLEATARIPYGNTHTYAQVAAAAGKPSAVRAAGSGLASNPVPIVVPCHRVVRTGGTLGGYAGGPERKELLLALERC